MYESSQANALMSDYYDGLNPKLLDAIPAAGKILELGCANGQLGRRYKQLHPHSYWVGVDICASAVAIARQHIDQAHLLDLDRDGLDAFDNDFDVIVFGDLLEHIKQPHALLTALRQRCRADARLICCIPNMSNTQVIARLLAGDISYDDAGLLDRTHLRFFSPRSAIKHLLDAGWLPNLVDSYVMPQPNQALQNHLIAAAGALGIDAATAHSHLNLCQMVFDCRLLPAVNTDSSDTKLSVITHSQHPETLALNLMRSPGLTEINAEILPLQGASSAASALSHGLGLACGEWIVFCQPDVYLPPGSGRQLLAHLDAIAPAQRPGTLIGFAGLRQDTQGHVGKDGRYVDGNQLFDHRADGQVIALADFAIVLHRESIHRPDPSLGWQLWATDLCLRALQSDHASQLNILHLPLFHNRGQGGNTVQQSSAQQLRLRYANLGSIHTLYGQIASDG